MVMSFAWHQLTSVWIIAEDSFELTFSAKLIRNKENDNICLTDKQVDIVIFTAHLTLINIYFDMQKRKW